jgi:hypothetical protein
MSQEIYSVIIDPSKDDKQDMDASVLYYRLVLISI